MKNVDYKNFLFILPLGILLWVMIPNLSLPFFYDEAWSYFPAIKKMADLGPTMLPGKLSIDDCKGHPQFIFFLAALWIKIFSANTIILRLLPLLISISLIVIIYWGLLKILNWESAFIGSLLVSVQSMFLAQSIMLLPEVLMALLFVVSFFMFLRKKFFLYSIFSSLLVLTKETAIIFCLLFGIFYLFSLFSRKERNDFQIGHLFALITPGIVYAVFLYLHYKAYGVILYGEHLDYISFDWPTIHDKIDRAYSFIFIRYGRKFISISGIILTIVVLFHKQVRWKPILLSALAFLAFMTFSMFNYYTQRYGLIAIIIFLIVFAMLLGQLKINSMIKVGIATILSAVCLFQSLTIKENSDVDLGYVETIRTYEDIVHYCEDQKWQDESFSVTFNMIFALRDKDLGYVKGEKQFSNVMDWKHYMEAKYFIYESAMGDPPPGVNYAQEHFKLVKEFKNKHAWGYIYEKLDEQKIDSLTNKNN